MFKNKMIATQEEVRGLNVNIGHLKGVVVSLETHLFAFKTFRAILVDF